MPLTTRLTPQKRRLALEQLSHDRLADLSERFGLDVGDSRVAENHINALLRARSLDFGELLGSLKREELQTICEALGLERGGREKDVLVQRILAEASELSPTAPDTRGRGNGQVVGVQSALNLPMFGKLTVDQLERHLWSAADILRGSIDSSDYKNFIFGLLFLKRISDVFEEEAARLIAEGHPPEVAWDDKDEHQFFVPKSARWSEIQKVATNIGEALNKACATLEEANTALDGILRGEDRGIEVSGGEGQRDGARHPA